MMDLWSHLVQLLYVSKHKKCYVCLHSSCLFWVLLTAFLIMQLEVTDGKVNMF